MNSADDSLPPSGQTLRQALRLLVTTLDARSIHYAIIGGIATIQHARVRTTNDIDVLLDVPSIAMPALFEALEADGFIVDSKGNIAELSRDGLTTIQFGDVLVDVMRPVLPLYSHVLDRAVSMGFVNLRIVRGPLSVVVCQLSVVRCWPATR